MYLAPLRHVGRTFEQRARVADSHHAKRHSGPTGADTVARSTATADARSGAATRPDAVTGSDAAARATALSNEPAATSEKRAAVEERERPLGAYALLSGVFATAFGVPLAVAERRGALPERIPASDLALLAAGTFKVSRLVTRDAVTGYVRAPFVEFEGMEGVTKPKESPRGRGFQRAVGQLLVCPGCVALWAAASLTTALLVAPRPTRVVCSALSAFAASDFLQAAYVRSTTTS